MDWTGALDVLYASPLASAAQRLRAGAPSAPVTVILDAREAVRTVGGGDVIVDTVRAWVRASDDVQRGDTLRVGGTDWRVLAEHDTGAGERELELRRL